MNIKNLWPVLSGVFLAACFPSLPPDEADAASDIVDVDTSFDGIDTVVPIDDVVADAMVDVSSDDISVDVSEDRWITNLPSEVQTSWGREGSFAVALSDAAASPTRRFAILRETCSFDVLVGATDGALRWTCPAAVERCVATVEVRDGLRTETAALEILCVNALPAVSDVVVEPASAFPGETLTCKYRFEDADGDADRSTIQWFDGATPIGEGVEIQAPFLPGRSASCAVTPHDGLESASAQSADVAITGFSSVSAGTGHTCAVASDGHVWCWGFNNIGQLGSGTTEDSTRPRPVADRPAATRVESGSAGSCILKPGGEISCWGLKPEGWLLGPELADLDPGLIATRPATVAITNVSHVTSGGLFACALNNSAKVWCWGNNGDGALGLGNNDGSAAPVQVPNLNGVSMLDAGDAHVCVVVDGTLYCWGSNDRGQLGIGDFSPRNVRTLVNGPTGVTALAVGGQASCARNANGWACWGHNASGQLGLAGNAASEPRVFSPTHSNELSVLESVSLGRNHTCGLTSNGEVKCLGNGSGGRLGNNQTAQSSSLQAVMGLPTPATHVSVGAFHACAIAGGWPYCWGENGFGQLGTGDRFDKLTATPVVTPVR